MMVGKLFTMLKARNGKLLAECIQSSLSASIEKDNTRVSKAISGIYIVDHVDIPLSIVECGFLSNPSEASLLSKDEYQDRLAWGIFVGISNYFNE